MKFISAIAVFVVCQATSLAAERTVAIARGSRPFNVTQDVIVRFIVTAVPGSQISTHLEGPATIDSESNIEELIDGRPAQGMVTKEYDLKPNGKGEVKLDVTITPPQPGSDSTIKHFKFTVGPPPEPPKPATPKSETPKKESSPPGGKHPQELSD
jgi:hypothetical protein